MNFIQAVDSVYDHIKADRVHQAVLECLRLSRHLRDSLYTGYFLHELYPGKDEFARVIYDDIKTLNKEAQHLILNKSLAFWLETHTLDYSLGVGNNGEKKNVLAINIGEFDSEIEGWQHSIEDQKVPSGMGEYDTAAFFDESRTKIAGFRLRIKAMQTVKERVKTRCFNYIVQLERQLEAQATTRGFLDQVQDYVNNFLKSHSPDAYLMIQKASVLVGSSEVEDQSLLLTEIRRALKATADYFFPPASGRVKCADGQERLMGEEQYMNRFQEFVLKLLPNSIARDVVLAELNLLTRFARRLNEVASKGVHGVVTQDEAKQGFLGLYLFLYNVIRRLQENEVLGEQ